MEPQRSAGSPNYRSHAARLSHLHNLRTRSFQQPPPPAASPAVRSGGLRLVETASVPVGSPRSVRLDERTYSPSSGSGRAVRQLQLMVGQLELSEARVNEQLALRAHALEGLQLQCSRRMRTRREEKLLARACKCWRAFKARRVKCHVLLQRGCARFMQSRLRVALQAWHRESYRAQAAFIRSSRRELHELEENRVRTKAARFAKREAEKAFEAASAELRATKRAHADTRQQLDEAHEAHAANEANEAEVLAGCKISVGTDDVQQICAELLALRRTNAEMQQAVERSAANEAETTDKERRLERSLANMCSRSEESELANEQLRKEAKSLQQDVRKLRVELDGAVAATRRAVQVYGRTLRPSSPVAMTRVTSSSSHPQPSPLKPRSPSPDKMRRAAHSANLLDSTVRQMRAPAIQSELLAWSPPVQVAPPVAEPNIRASTIQRQAQITKVFETAAASPPPPPPPATQPSAAASPKRMSAKEKLSARRAASAGSRSPLQARAATGAAALSLSTVSRVPAASGLRAEQADREAAGLGELKALMQQAITGHDSLWQGAERVESMAMASAQSQAKAWVGVGGSIERLEGMAMGRATSVAKLARKQSNDRQSKEAMLMQAAMNGSRFEKAVGDRTVHIESLLVSQAHSVSKLTADSKKSAAAAAAAQPVSGTASTKQKTRGALLAGLRSGKLEAAVAKMEADTAADEVGAAASTTSEPPVGLTARERLLAKRDQQSPLKAAERASKLAVSKREVRTAPAKPAASSTRGELSGDPIGTRLVKGVAERTKKLHGTSRPQLTRRGRATHTSEDSPDTEAEADGLLLPGMQVETVRRPVDRMRSKLRVMAALGAFSKKAPASPAATTARSSPPPGSDAPPPPVSSGVAATKQRTRGALLAGLRSGKLEAAVAKMEQDTSPAVREAEQADGEADGLGELKAIIQQAITGHDSLWQGAERVESMAMASAQSQAKAWVGVGGSIERLEGMAMGRATSVAKLARKQSNDRQSKEAMLMQAAMNGSRFEKAVGDRTVHIESLLVSQAHSVSKLTADSKKSAAAAAAAQPVSGTASTKQKTRGALLAGLRSGKLEAAVAKMEADTAADEVGAASSVEGQQPASMSSVERLRWKREQSR